MSLVILLMRVVIGNSLFRRRLMKIESSDDPRLLNLLEICRVQCVRRASGSLKPLGLARLWRGLFVPSC